MPLINDEIVFNIFFIRSSPKFSCLGLIVTLAKSSFLAVLLNSEGKLCRLSYCIYIFRSSSKTILKQNMEQMEETFMLLHYWQRLYQIHCSNKAAVISKCNPCFKYSKCPGDALKLTDLHINTLTFQKLGVVSRGTSF